MSAAIRRFLNAGALPHSDSLKCAPASFYLRTRTTAVCPSSFRNWRLLDALFGSSLEQSQGSWHSWKFNESVFLSQENVAENPES